MTPTNRLSGFETSLATNSDSGSRVPRGHAEHYSDVGAVLIGLLSVAWLRAAKSNVEVAGSLTVDMRDFGIEVPDISFTTAQPQVIIEFRLLLVHG